MVELFPANFFFGFLTTYRVFTIVIYSFLKSIILSRSNRVQICNSSLQLRRDNAAACLVLRNCCSAGKFFFLICVNLSSFNL